MKLTAVEEKDFIEKISLLDDIDKRGERDGRTLLIHSVFYNCRQIAEYFIKNGSTINLKDKQGFTALHAAVSSGNTELVELLLSNGASVNEKDVYGNTPLHRTTPQNPRIIKLLLAAGADCYDENNYGVSTYQIFLAYPDIIDLFES